MKNKLRTVLSILVVMAFIFAILSGCGTAKTNETQGTTAPAATEATTAAPADDGKVKLPLTDKPVTFKVFYPINRIEADMTKNELWKKLSKDTGINFEWENPIGGAGATEAYNLMLASGNLPDLVVHSGALSYKGGYSQAIDDKIYIDLKGLVQKNAPLYWKALSSNQAVLRDALTDKGELPGLWNIAQLENDKYQQLMGIMLRGDWLEELKLPVPQTIDEWYITLKTFKEKKNCDFPLLIGPVNGMEAVGMFTSAFGITTPPVSQNAIHQMFYPDAQGKMHYGGIEQGYQEYLQVMSKWYKEGLFDRDFTTRGMRDLPGRAQVFGAGKAGAVAVYPEWTGMFFGSTQDKNMKMVAAPYPAKVAGEKQKIFISRSKYLDQPSCITTACKQPELLVSFFNYLCTEEGINMMNYGMEGDDFTMVDGQPKFTDKIMKNALGVAGAAENFAGSIRPIHTGALPNYMIQANPPANLEAKKIFADSSDPFFCAFQLTGEEGAKLSQIMNDIVTYTAEETVKAYMNADVAEKWMDVQAKQIKSMNIDEAIAIVQGAYDRYLARK